MIANLFTQTYGVHITSLVIKSLGGGHTYTYTHTSTHTDFVDKNNFKKPGVR